MRKWIAFILAVSMCILLCACGGGTASKETVLDSYSSSLTLDDVVKVFGENYEKVEGGDILYSDISCFGKAGYLRAFWYANYCAWSWSYEKQSETNEEYEKLGNNFVKQLEKRYGSAAQNKDVYTWNQGETEIELTIGEKSIYLRQRSNDTYYKGIVAIANGNYQDGKAMLEEIGRFDVNSDDVKAAMYDFVLLNKNKSHSSSIYYDYIYKLNKDNYKDAKDLYNELYSWKITVTGISTKEYSIIIEDTLSIKDTIYFSVELTGGEPNAKTKIKSVTTWPDGSKSSYTTDDEWEKGYTGWFSAYNIPAEGILKKDFYDDAGNHIGSGSVRIVK